MLLRSDLSTLCAVKEKKNNLFCKSLMKHIFQAALRQTFLEKI